MKRIFFTILFLSTITLSILAHPVAVNFQSMDVYSLPIESEPTEEDDLKEIKNNTTTAGVFNSTYAVIFFGLVGVYMLLLRKKESRGMNL